jgi:cell division protein YceG involved in septum cleavage
MGLDPKTIDFSTIDSPYNSYRNDGLPPTPISNPGADALNAAVTPTPGNWTYYVNDDAAGHLFFTNDENQFTQAQQKCYDNNWGCAAP